MKEQFINWRPTGKVKQLLEQIESIVDQYEAMGYVLTLRQLYYRLVTKNIIENTVRSYKSLERIVNKARPVLNHRLGYD